jgi:hypothetical protein
MDAKQKIIDLVKSKGPVIPVQVSKEIGSDILMASAHLSELSSEGKLKISNIKVGGTPLYYLPGQETALENFSDNLHEKEKKAFDLLKEKKILRDSKLEPVMRVALREIKDFAVPLQVTYQNTKEIFWRWHSLGKEETETLIKSMLSKKIAEPETAKRREARQETLPEPTSPPPHQPPKPTMEKPKDQFLEEIKSYFNKNKIIVKSSEIIRKNSEIDFIIEVSSAIGTLEYYCKAKNKKRINDNDLSSAYVQGQLKKLPVLFLTKGELTKRAREMLDNDFKNININKI